MKTIALLLHSVQKVTWHNVGLPVNHDRDEIVSRPSCFGEAYKQEAAIANRTARRCFFTGRLQSNYR